MTNFEKGSFIRPKGKGHQRKPDQENSKQKNTLYPDLSPSSRRLMGLREYKKLSPEEEQNLFHSFDRFATYSKIDTSTNPRRPHIENKKGVVREIVGNKLINESVLKDSATVYFGSGTDVEYVLALGARNIYLVDPIYQDPQAIADLKSHIERLILEQLPDQVDDILNFQFDFGSSDESVSVRLIPKEYGHDHIDFPDNIGLVVTYASQGPTGRVEIGEDVEHNMVDDAYILDGTKLQHVVSGKKEVINLGAE